MNDFGDDPAAKPEAQTRKQEARHEGARNTDSDVAQQAEPAALDDEAGISGASWFTTMPSASASSSESSGYLVRSVRNGGDFWFGLSPRGPMAWHGAHLLSAMALPRATGPEAASAGELETSRIGNKVRATRRIETMPDHGPAQAAGT